MTIKMCGGLAQMVKNHLQCKRPGIPGSGRSPGEGNCNPLQYSCLGNPMDRRAWQATIHGVTKGQTWLNDLTPVTTDVGHPLTCFLITVVSSFIKCSIFCPFKSIKLFFLLLNCWISLYILNTILWLDVCIWSSFHQYVAYVPIFLIMLFEEQKFFFVLMQSRLLIFNFMVLDFLCPKNIFAYSLSLSLFKQLH